MGEVTYKNQYTIEQDGSVTPVAWVIIEKATGDRVCTCDESLSKIMRVWKALEIEAFTRFLG